MRRLGSASLLHWTRAVFSDHHYRRGDWDEALATAESFLAAVEAGSPNVVAWQAFTVRAFIRLARGDTAGAVADAEAALRFGRAAAEVQAVCFVLAAAAYVFDVASERERATVPAQELLELLRNGTRIQFAVVNLPVFTAAAVRLGLTEELVPAIDHLPTTRWTEASRAYACGDFVAAAELLRQIGVKPEEAEARLRAAEQLARQSSRDEAKEQLRRALAFYRSVGAAHFVRECEAIS